MPTFEIPDGPTAVDAPRSAEATAVYSVTNTAPDSCDGRLSVVAAGASKSEWFSIDGNRERTYAPGETQTATVRIKIPADVPGGEYPFRLRAVAVNDPDNDHAEGPMTVAKLAPAAVAKPRSLLWLWILLGVIALIAIGGGLYFLLSGDKDEPPVKTVTAAPARMDTAQALRLAEKKTAAWISAFNQRDNGALVEMSDVPFYFDSELMMSKSELKDKYASITERGSGGFKIDKITPYAIGDLRKSTTYLEHDRVMNALKLGDDDIAVVVMTGGEGTIFFFRRSDNDVAMAGFWN